jgi:hypothetical protein
MVLRIPRPIGLTALVFTLFLAGAGVEVPANIARADNCLPAPNSPTPQGNHWYYRMDWPRQRKCWYLRAPDQPPQEAPQVVPEAASAAPSKLAPEPSAAPSDDASASARVKTLSVRQQPALMTNAAADGPVRSSAQGGSGAPSNAPAPVPPANMAQRGARAPAASAGVVWPDPPPAIPSPAATNAVAISNDAGAGSSGREAGIRMSEDSQSSVARAASTATAAVPQSVTATPVEMLLLLALGLAAAGILSRIVMKFAAARRQPIITDYAELDWIDDNALQPQFLDDPSDQEFAAHSDGYADFPTGRSQPPAASLRRRNPAAPASPSVVAEDLEATERVIMRVLHRARA